MGISRAQLLAEILPALNELFGLEYETGWAAYYSYYPEDMTYRVDKVEPWDSSKHTRMKKGKRVIHPGILHITDAPDELGAYVEATRRLEGADK
jgi:hypothetical protein